MNDTVPTNARFVDPHVALKDADVKGNLVFHEEYPVFGLVEFNIWGACNRRCEFCPISDPKIFTNRKEGISVDNYKKILKDLRNIDYSGVILWSMFSEPTLHKEIFQLARITKARLPAVSLQITSNGDFFRRREDKLRLLFDTGVDRINLSLYDSQDQFVEFTNIRKRLGLSQSQLRLRRRFKQEGNYGISISNRAGLVDSNKYRAETEESITSLPLSQSCYYPFYQVAIDYNGDVLLCPHDWSKDYIAGNAFEESIWNIWKGPRFENARTKLMNNSRSIASCKKCDVAGNLIGKTNFLAFS